MKAPEESVNIHDSPNARDWASRFAKYYSFPDVETMVVWFSNAMMAMHDFVKRQERKTCNVCGSSLVSIRGKYPNSENRYICPTCAYEKLEQIQEISSPSYGVAVRDIKQIKIPKESC
jgi:hypothetical protein